MTANNAISGNARLIALVLLAVAVAAGAGFFFFKKSGSSLDAALVTTPDGTVVDTAQMPPTIVSEGDEEPVAAQQPADAIAQEAVVAPGTSAEPVKIDLEKAFAPRVLGKADAPIKIIEYASLTCSHCAHFHNDVLPELKAKYIDTGKVSIEFREFPLNDPALKAALTARCLPEDKYEGFTALLFKTQERWAAGLEYMTALKQNAKLAGMSDATFDACQGDPKLKEKLAEIMQAAQDKWKISSTPTFIINDGAEVVSGAQPLAEFERVFRKVSGDTVGEVPAVQ